MATEILHSILSGASLLVASAALKFAYSMVQRVTSLETKVGLYWGTVEKQISAQLHSPHRPKLDVLLDKNTKGEPLTTQEAEQMVDLLQKLIDSRELNSNETGWAIQLMAVTVAKYELGN